MNLQIFSHLDFPKAIQTFFERLSIPVNYVDFHPTTGKEILVDTYKDNESFQLMKDVYFMGMVDDAAFVGNASKGLNDIESDYDGILVFGVTLHERENGLLPTRSQLSEITRAFNREFYYTPVVVIFKYGHHIAFANTERLKYTQEWREGEKAGKVSLLRDIDIENPHAGHERILKGLKISTSGTNKIDSFSKLYEYWQEVFNVNILNKKFYDELSNWYFWASQNVVFPGEPTMADAHLKNAKLEDLLQEHRATNVIRMLTRLLFVWFIKEKGLIPEELFELSDLQENILNDISPYHQEGLYKEHNLDSVYYKAILQNLFFATLNCPIKADSIDKRTRGFRGDGYGTHRGIDYLMRYKKYFKNPEAFLEKLNEVVPFLNGGLFECLDDKFNNVYIDGFSDNMAKGEQLIVPDYLFFGVEEQADLSEVVGIKNKKYKEAAVKGLINILKSYKFTITENTPIEEDVALDPELLGKVFENLLASYNPETKTTARKQTGSFYTPREIVNYMVDESLIAYLKNAITDWGGLEEDSIDKELHVLTSFDSKIPFEGNLKLQKEIITALSSCKILDPACGSGAFPMGILQKMVHILQKLDPDNEIWKEVQLEKAEQESKAAFAIEDKHAREQRLLEINEAFDQSINDADYARKLFLIENCIYGVDIQPIATQISKLRFFISLVVEQKVSSEKENFGIRPLPNLETKFVTANTLIGIDKPSGQTSLFETKEIKTLEKELKLVRGKLFGARSKETKLKYRNRDEELRKAIGSELKKSGWQSESAEKLSGWDPYDQNASAPFFDPEWMFDIKDGFDVVIGNPPYGATLSKAQDKNFRIQFPDLEFKIDTYEVFILRSNLLMKKHGLTTYIVPSNLMDNFYSKKIRLTLLNNGIKELVELDDKVFTGAVVHSMIISWTNHKKENYKIKCKIGSLNNTNTFLGDKSFFLDEDNYSFTLRKVEHESMLNEIYANSFKLEQVFKIKDGIDTGNNSLYVSNEKMNGWKKLIGGKNVDRWEIKDWRYIDYGSHLANPRDPELFENDKIIIRETGNRIIATIDKEGYYALSTLYSGFIIDKKYSLEAILALLHSELIHFIMVLIAFGRTEGAFTKTRIFHYYSLPVNKDLPKYDRELSTLVNYIIFLKKFIDDEKIIDYYSTIINSVIYEIFFKTAFRLANKDILIHLKDLKSINDNMSKEEKLNIIHSEYKRLSYQKHPIHQNIETIDDIKEIRAIRKALKS